MSVVIASRSRAFASPSAANAGAEKARNRISRRFFDTAISFLDIKTTQYNLQEGSGHLSVIDLHSHIVPGVDDGARTYSEASEMIRRMRDNIDGNFTVVFTPHYSSTMSSRVIHTRSERANLFQDRIEEEFPERLSFLTAGELMVRGHFLKHMEQVRYPGTGWVLIEFSTSVTWIETLIQVRRIINRGYMPLIAHPERYRWCRRKRSRLIKLSKMGCGVLVSARSLTFEKYATAARNLLRDGLCHAICSDAHSPRDYILDKGLKKKLEHFSRIPWSVITRTMPELILNDMKLPELPLLEQKKVL